MKQLLNYGKKFATTIDKVKIMTLWREGMSRKDISIHTIVPLRTVQRVILANRNLPETSVPVRKPGFGRPKKTSAATDRILKRTILKYPMMTAKELKEELAQELQNVSVHTIQHRLQKDLKIPCRSAAMKPLITEKMRKKRVAFAKKFKDWTPEQWGKVMFRDESTFRTLRVVQRKVRRPLGSYQYSSRYT